MKLKDKQGVIIIFFKESFEKKGRKPQGKRLDNTVVGK